MLVAAARRVGLLAGTVLIVAMGLVFWRQLADFRDPFVPWREDAAVLLATDWGRAWMMGAIGAVLLPWPILAAPPGAEGRAMRRAPWIMATVLAAGVCAFPALTGHAAGCWIGGLFLCSLQKAWCDIEAITVAAFSPTRYRCSPPSRSYPRVCSSPQEPSPVSSTWSHRGALFASAYGRLLLAKIALALMVMILGAINWRLLTPRLREGKNPGALRRNAIRELVIAQLVIVITALLVRTPPMDLDR